MNKSQKEGICLVQVVRTETGGAVIATPFGQELVIPEAEQAIGMPSGSRHPVYVYPNPLSGKWYASGKLAEWAHNQDHPLKQGQQVTIWTWYPSPMGWNVVVDATYLGLIYHSDVYNTLKPGMELQGYVHELREGNLMDIRLRNSGASQQLADADLIFNALNNAGGFLPFGDHSDPEEIRNTFSMSKKAFKKALGTLYRNGRITFKDNGIRITS